MIAKIVTGTGSNVKNLLQYLTKKDHSVLTSNNLFPNASLDAIVKDIRMVQALNQRGKKNINHIILSFPKDEKIDDVKLQNITYDFMKEFGAKNHQWITYKHYDTDHIHCHTVLNKVDTSGKLLSNSHSFSKAKRICRSLEFKYSLTIVSNINEVSNSLVKIQLGIIIDEAIEKCTDILEIKNFIEDRGWKVHLGRGIAFTKKKDGTKIKGSSIGREYSLANIKDRILKMDIIKQRDGWDNNKAFRQFLANNGNIIENPFRKRTSDVVEEEHQVDLFKKKKRKTLGL